MSVLDEGYSRNASPAIHLMSTFLLLSLGRYFYWRTSSPLGYHPTSSSCFGTDMTWFIRYMFIAIGGYLIIVKTKVSSFEQRWLHPIFAILLRPFDCIALQSFYFERSWWRLSRKRVVHTKFDVYVFTKNNEYDEQWISSCQWPNHFSIFC